MLLPTSHSPFHVAGTGPRPVSSRLFNSGQTPVSRTPMMTWLCCWDAGKSVVLLSSPRNCGVLVVWRLYRSSGVTERIPGRLASVSASWGVSLVEKP